MKLSNNNKVLFMLSCCCLLTITLHATSSHENGIDSIDRTLKKKKLLGECEGNCYKNEDCANGYLCSRRNKRTLRMKRYDPRLAFCSSYYTNNNNEYVCYDPLVVQAWPACPSNTEDSNSCDSTLGGGYFYNISNYCMYNGKVNDECCRPRKRIINDTASICLKYQVCNSYRICECDSFGIISCIYSDPLCIFQPPCIN